MKQHDLHVKHKQGEVRPATRTCVACGVERPLVLFPRLQTRAISARCQLCRDTGRRAEPRRDLRALTEKARKAHRRKREQERATSS